MPDLEIPIIYLIGGLQISGGTQNRLVLHSFLGAASIGTFLSVLLTILLYPSVISFFFKLDKEMVKEKCRFSRNLVILCLVGTLSHVFLDSMTHNYNPVLYPFVKESFDILRFTKNLTVANAIVHSVLLIPIALLFFYEFRKGSKDLWMRVLVG